MENQVSNTTENIVVKQRDSSLDIMKGIAMVFVVLGHVLHRNFRDCESLSVNSKYSRTVVK